MDLKAWATFIAELCAIIFVVALSVTVWKKNIRINAKRGEIITVAIILSVALTCTIGIGLGFPGIPWALVGYCIMVFFLQWLFDQKAIDKVWKLFDLVRDAELKKRGVDKKDLEALDE